MSLNIIFVVDSSSVMRSRPQLIQSAIQTVGECIADGVVATVYTFGNDCVRRCENAGWEEAQKHFSLGQGGMSNCHAALNKVGKEEEITPTTVVVIIAACQATDPEALLTDDALQTLQKARIVVLRSDKSVIPPRRLSVGMADVLSIGSDESVNRLRGIFNPHDTDTEDDGW